MSINRLGFNKLTGNRARGILTDITDIVLGYPLNQLHLSRHGPWWWCRPHPVHEHAHDLRPPLGARPASPPTRQAAQPPPRGSSTNPRPLV